MQALLGGHVMAPATRPAGTSSSTTARCACSSPSASKRTKRWPNVPTAKDLGYNVVSTSPYGIVGPKGMDPAIVKTLHDAFKKAMDDPKHAELMAQLNQVGLVPQRRRLSRSGRVETFAKDKALIDRLGLAK